MLVILILTVISNWTTLLNTKRSPLRQASCCATKVKNKLTAFVLKVTFVSTSLKNNIRVLLHLFSIHEFWFCWTCDSHHNLVRGEWAPTLPEEAATSDRADSSLTEAQALKQITFPEMDSDGLPSCYIPKVIACVGKWQLKMDDLASQLRSSGKNSSITQLLGLVYWFTCLFNWFVKFSWFPPNAQLPRHHLLSCLRLGEKSSQRSKGLAKRADEISDLNTTGIVDGFTGVYLASKKNFCLGRF